MSKMIFRLDGEKKSKLDVTDDYNHYMKIMTRYNI